MIMMMVVVGCYIWYSEEPSPLLAVPNVTTHPSTANASITVLLYYGPLLCGFYVAIKGLMCDRHIVFGRLCLLSCLFLIFYLVTLFVINFTVRGVQRGGVMGCQNTPSAEV